MPANITGESPVWKAQANILVVAMKLGRILRTEQWVSLDLADRGSPIRSNLTRLNVFVLNGCVLKNSDVLRLREPRSNQNIPLPRIQFAGLLDWFGLKCQP
jgi:hypothetical protein